MTSVQLNGITTEHTDSLFCVVSGKLTNSYFCAKRRKKKVEFLIHENDTFCGGPESVNLLRVLCARENTFLLVANFCVKLGKKIMWMDMNSGDQMTACNFITWRLTKRRRLKPRIVWFVWCIRFVGSESDSSNLLNSILGLCISAKQFGYYIDACLITGITSDRCLHLPQVL